MANLVSCTLTCHDKFLLLGIIFIAIIRERPNKPFEFDAIADNIINNSSRIPPRRVFERQMV